MKMVMIKKLAMKVAVAVAAVLAVACGSKVDKAASVEGEWELVDVEFATKSAVRPQRCTALFGILAFSAPPRCFCAASALHRSPCLCYTGFKAF